MTSDSVCCRYQPDSGSLLSRCFCYIEEDIETSNKEMPEEREEIRVEGRGWKKGYF